MAWTAPRTWVNLEVVSHTLMNTHVRDNLQYLKDIQDGAQGQDFTWSVGSSDALGRTIAITKARGSIGTPTSVASGDQVSQFHYQAYNNAGYRSVAIIRATATTVGATNIDGTLDFYTYRSSDGAPLNALRLYGGVAYVQDAAVSAPSLAFLNDPDNGLYRIGADDWALAAGGTLALELVKTGGVAQALAGTGSSSAPGHAFTGDADSGLARFNANDIGLVAGASVVVWTRLVASVTQLGFHGSTPQAKPTVTGAKGGNAALTSLLSALNTIGLITDSSS